MKSSPANQKSNRATIVVLVLKAVLPKCRKLLKYGNVHKIPWRLKKTINVFSDGKMKNTTVTLYHAAAIRCAAFNKVAIKVIHHDKTG